MTENFDVIVLAAGKGVRMHSDLPKVLHRVCGVALIERVLRSVSAIGSTRIVVVVGHGRDLVRSAVERFPAVEIVDQNEQRGTGHAVQVAWSKVRSERVMILPGDVPLLSSEVLDNVLRSQKGDEDLTVLTATVPNPAGYGRVVRNGAGEVMAIVEDRDCTPEERRIREINSSIYVAQRRFLDGALSQLSPDNEQREYYLTDIVRNAVKEGRKVKAIEVGEYHSVLGANTRGELAELEAHRRMEIAHRFLAEGVAIQNPLHTYIDEDVTIGRDCFLGAGTRLTGRTVLEEGVSITGDTVVDESRIGARSVIRFACAIESSQVGRECQIGPFAHLRPGSVLADRVHIGNFVETKMVKMDEGAKANHLTYLGDTDVGAGANIGAGTITCNYDGVAKHRTTIGPRAFIGSNTSLIAPVTVGAGAVTGASSAITRDVPDDALAVERSEQKVVPGWALRRQSKGNGE